VAKAVRSKQGKGQPSKGGGSGKSPAPKGGSGKSPAPKGGGKSPAPKGDRAPDAKPRKSVRSRAQARASARPARSREKRGPAKFMRDVRVELGKVSWPTRRDLVQSTLVVLVAVAIAAAYVAGLDAVFSEVVDQILNLIT
jgi:preprotein translocase subunit SecE